MILRIAATKLADQPAGQRRKDTDLVKPINAPRGISPEIKKEHGQTLDYQEDTISPNRRDITPKDVFLPKPNQTGVRNLAETGKDLAKVLKNQVPKDKGFDAVSNLSQYLIETGGGGSAKPVS